MNFIFITNLLSNILIIGLLVFAIYHIIKKIIDTHSYGEKIGYGILSILVIPFTLDQMRRVINQL